MPLPSKTATIDEKHRYIRKLLLPLKRKNCTPVWASDARDEIIFEPRIKGMKYENRVKLGYIYHTIVPLWMHYEHALQYYIFCHHRETKLRGIKCQCELETWFPAVEDVEDVEDVEYPPWIENMVPMHHKSLYRKDPVFYHEWKHYNDNNPNNSIDWELLYNV